MDLPISLIRLIVAVTATLLAAYSVVLRKEGRIVGGLFLSWFLFWDLVALLAIFWEALNPVWSFLQLADALHALSLAVVLLISLFLLRTWTVSSGVNDKQIHLARYIAIHEVPEDSKDASDDKRTRVAVLIPAYNAERSLPDVLRRISIPEAYKALTIVINDGSSDNTSLVAALAGALVIDHPFNIGQGGALKTGFMAAQRWDADIVACLDADGEHFPEDIVPLIKQLEESDLDMIVGSRFLGSDPDLSMSRKLGIRGYSWFVRELTGYQLNDVTCGFRVIKASYLQQLLYPSERAYAIAMLVLAHKAKMRIGESSVQFTKRVHGESQFHNLGTWFKYPFSIIRQLIEIYL